MSEAKRPSLYWESQLTKAGRGFYCIKNAVLKSKYKVPDVGQKWRTRILPPPLQNPIYMKGINYNRNDKPKNSNIQQQLTMKFYGKHLSHARVLLDHLEKTR